MIFYKINLLTKVVKNSSISYLLKPVWIKMTIGKFHDFYACHELKLYFFLRNEISILGSTFHFTASTKQIHSFHNYLNKVSVDLVFELVNFFVEMNSAKNANLFWPGNSWVFSDFLLTGACISLKTLCG